MAMKDIINVGYPKSLANTLKLSEKDFEAEIKASALVKLFELGKISSGVAASVLGLSRLDFIDLLAKYKVSVFALDVDDLSNEIANA